MALKTGTNTNSATNSAVPNKAATNSASSGSGATNTNFSVGATDFDRETGQLDNLLPSFDSIPAFAVGALKLLLLVIGGLAVVVILIGGFRLTVSQGNQKSVEAGKSAITWAVVGLIIALLSYSLVINLRKTFCKILTKE